MNSSLAEIKTGTYKHYKNNEYEVLGFGRHTETGEEFVIYKPKNGNDKLWIRPFEMFFEDVEINGELVPRFQFISN